MPTGTKLSQMDEPIVGVGNGAKKSGTLANHLLEEAGLSNRIKGMRGGSLLGCQTFFVSVLRRVFVWIYVMVVFQPRGRKFSSTPVGWRLNELK